MFNHSRYHQPCRSQAGHGTLPTIWIHVLKRSISIEISWKVFGICSFWIVMFHEVVIKIKIQNLRRNRESNSFRKTFKQFDFKLLSANFTKWPNTLKQFVGNFSTNCLSVFGQLVGLALKGLKLVWKTIHSINLPWIIFFNLPLNV